MNNLSCFILAYTEPLEPHPDKASNDDVAKVHAGSIRGHWVGRDGGTWKNGFDVERTLLVKCNKRLTVYN
jgi:hypothetical protein